MGAPTPPRKSGGGEPVRSEHATAKGASSNSGAGGDEAAAAAEESEEEFTTEEFEVELDDGATWAMNFYECAAEGDVKFLKQILDDAKVNVDDTDVDGFTALMIAAAEGHKHIVMELLERGADVAVRTHELRSTALHFAAKNGDAEIVDAICKKDPRYVDCWNINADTPLIWACIEGRAACVRVLLSYNADVDVVNQYGATSLICSVMIGEDPEEDESDDARSEIIKMLLAKNPKLVNFQDREGSTAMHLAASCGYLQCVKTLLECGADITLRNAIGQTPLEEAEQTGLDESDVCVDHLRAIWQNLEEEAAARMMTMLEMEEQSARGGTAVSKTGSGGGGVANSSSGVSGVAGSSKKSKKKNKKQKRKAAKQQAQSSGDPGASSTEIGGSNASSQDDSKIAESSNDAVSSGESSDEDEIEKTESSETGGAQSAVAVAETPSEVQDSDLIEDNAGISGVWTTVGKKQHSKSAAAAAAVAAASQEDAETEVGVTGKEPSAPALDGSGSASTPAGRTSKSPTQKVAPFRRKFKQHRYESSGSASVASGTTVTAGSSSASSTAASSSSAKVTPGAEKKGGSASENSRVGASPPTSSRLATSNTTNIGSNRAALPYSSTPIFSSSSSQFTSPFSTRNHERVRNHLGFSSSWRASGLGSATTGSGMSSYSASTSGYTSANRSLWKHSQRVSGNQLAAAEARDKWVNRLHLANENVSEAIGYLACGICGELVNDNLQCNVSVNGSGCAQLYCGTCLAKTLATSDGLSLKCVKCHQFMNRDEMQPNHFAQAQAASLGLPSAQHFNSNSSISSQEAEPHLTIDEMKHALESSIPNAAIVDLNPFYLTPGSNLAVLSNGQLEILEQAHQLALTHIMETRIANARAQERMQIEEWMKTQRDILHFAAMTSAATSAAVTSGGEQKQIGSSPSSSNK